MAPVTYLDTHIAALLFAGSVKRVPRGVRQLLGESLLRVSPMVLLELDYLREVGRINPTSSDILRGLEAYLGVSVCEIPFPRIVHEASRLTWTRDPFDRIIVAHAAVTSSVLLTRDRSILDHYPLARWGD